MTARRWAAVRRTVVPTVLLATITVLALSVGGCTSSSPSTAAPTLKDVSTLLVHHGKAVLGHDRKGFLADLASGAKSSTFRDDQEGVFDNLITLPLTQWSYAVGVPTDDLSAQRAATKKYGSSALIVRVTLRYALRDVDARSTTHDLYWTFLRQRGKVVIAGGADLADDGGVSWRGPWDFGPLTVVRGRSSLVLGHAPYDAQFKSYAAVVDAAVPVVTSVWGAGWAQQVAVLVPSSSDELAADAGPTSTATSDVAAVAVTDSLDPLTRAARGQRLIVNPGAVSKLSAAGLRITIQHEVTHIATASTTTDAAPRWLVEGFADYVGLIGNHQSVPTVAAELRADVRRGKLPKTLPTEQNFDTDGQSAQAYEGGWLACRLIAVRAGQAGLVRFYRLVAGSDDAEHALGTGLRDVLHESTARFTAQWRSYLQSQLG